MVLIVPPQPYVDASYFQAVIDIEAYKAAGYSRIAHRATYRDTGTDGAFISRWPTFTGLTRQAYHFAYNGDTPVKAAQHFLNVVDSVGGFHPADEAMLDCEWFQDGAGNWIGLNPAYGKTYAQTFLETVAAAYPDVRLFVYGNAWWFEAAGITSADLPNVGMITAAYGAAYRTPSGWPHSCIWQYTDRQSVPGFPGELVDCNRITCPSGLAHLTYGDDMSQADIDAINAHTDEKLANLATLLASRFDRGDAADKQIAQALTVLYGAQKPDGTGPVDPTHTGIGDLARALKLLPAGMASAVTAAVEQHLPNVTVDQTALEAAVAAAIDKHLSGATITLTPKAAQ